MKKDLKNIAQSKYPYGSMGWNLTVENNRLGHIAFKSGMFAFSAMWILGVVMLILALLDVVVTSLLVIFLKALGFTSQNPVLHFIEIMENFNWTAMDPCIDVLIACLAYFMIATGVSEFLHWCHCKHTYKNN